MFKKLNSKLIQDRRLEELLYERVVRELEQGLRRDGLWAKAYTEAKGSEKLAKSLYMKYRVQSLKDEIHLEDQRVDDAVDEALKKCKKSKKTKNMEHSTTQVETNKEEHGARTPLIILLIFGIIVIVVGSTP